MHFQFKKLKRLFSILTHLDYLFGNHLKVIKIDLTLSRLPNRGTKTRK